MARPVYRVAVGPGDVGTRVTLRRSLAADHGPPYGDVVGELLGWGDGAATVRRRSGEVVRVDLATVVAARRVPPAPPHPSPDAGGDA